MTSKYLFVFAKSMLSNISKAELAELTRKMRANASLHKDSLPQKRKASVGVVQIQYDKNEHTISGLFFKKKRPETTPPTSDLFSSRWMLNCSYKNILGCFPCAWVVSTVSFHFS